MEDAVIIGGGPAGFTAAIYAVRAGLKTRLFEKTMWGGQVANTTEIENYPGIPNMSGVQYAMKLYEQATGLGVTVENKEVIKAELDGEIKKIYLNNEEVETKSVIIAAGVRRRLLHCEGEKEFTGKGVSYCATCDGTFFKGKTVALVGGGNTALEDVLFLANHCEKVYLIHRRKDFRAEQVLVERVKERSNIEILYETVITKITGDNKVNQMEISNIGNDEQKEVFVEGVFVAIGYESANEIYTDQLKLNAAGYIVTDENCCTNIEGVYAAGDCREKKLKQIITAAADGAMAGFEAANYYNRRNR